MTDNGLRLITPGRVRLRTETGKRIRRLLLLSAALLTAGLLLLPAARNGLASLANRIMDASEQANAYAYRRIPAAGEPDEGMAAALIGAAGLCLGGALAVRARRVSGLAAAILCAGAQAYFGLPLPAAWNIMLFTLAGILTADRITVRKALCIAAAAAVLAGTAAAIRPGVNVPVETASEHVRDLLEPAAEDTAGGLPEEDPDARRETQHTDTRSLTEGDRKTVAERQYRLVTVEKEQISQPEWINYLKIALLLLAASAAVILPFIPAAAVNRRRKKAREARKMFSSPDRNLAVCAMFRHAARYLDKTGHGAGNIPFREWPAALAGNMPEKYVDSFQKCCILFEKAAYSDRELTEEQAEQVRDLLAETERLLYDQAGWRERLRLRYAECLHE